MTFHQCDTKTVDCMDPMKHETRIASSQDGKQWRVLSSILPFQGSVPDVLIRDERTLHVSLFPKLHRMSPTEKKSRLHTFMS